MALMHFIRPQRLLSSILALSSLVCGTAFSGAIEDLDSQRELYDQAQRWLDEDKVDEAKKIRNKIKNYPLTPYLDYRSLLVDIGNKPPLAVQVFIDTHQDFPFSNRIRAPYLDALAAKGKWTTLLDFQKAEPNDEPYRCHYYNAHYQTGQRDIAFKGAQKLWLSGSSISDACDPLFTAWSEQGGLTDDWLLKRMLLAFDGRNLTLMKYLQKKLVKPKSQATAQAMMDLYRSPENVLTFAKQYTDGTFNQQSIQFALEKLARQDAKLAQSVYQTLLDQKILADAYQRPIAEYIARILLDTEEQALVNWRDNVIAQSSNSLLLEQRIRKALTVGRWDEVKFWTEQLPADEKASLRWQYWLGRADIALGDEAKGLQRLNAMIGQRNFYSVAAANMVKQSINYPSTSIKLNPNLLTPYKKALVRIQELIERDKIAAAKSEWKWLLDRADTKEKEMLAAYADSQRWYSLTVTASISARMWDNMQLRFPLAHQWWFNFYGQKHDIDPIMLMSLARQESGMDVEAQSPVGARGIMQIMPSTAKYTAKKYQLTYNDEQELYEVGKNIEIGSHYLNGLLEQYGDNRIFAFAAYNAGPNRVNQWREKTQGKLDAYAFIEAIPFRETRGYVQNILMFETYYRDLMGIEGEFLNQDELNTKY
ncbi:transglycosylase SLT domain-containing protein [Vibrio anguillarum]|uniref:transglycosylase SLT domain-containing protein n=1 Tax=Vibrio anguillarum TaxID=55601 RepID=UPI00188D944C|nr:transglycosylase SLT domain-containing protein [Vibrio anguillarum]